MKKLFLLFLLFILVSCTSNSELDNFIKNSANQDWYEYSYDVIENHTKNDTRYHVIYYYKIANTSKLSKIEYIVYRDTNGDYIMKLYN